MFTIQNEYFCVIGQHIRHPKKICNQLSWKLKYNDFFTKRLQLNENCLGLWWHDNANFAGLKRVKWVSQNQWIEHDHSLYFWTAIIYPRWDKLHWNTVWDYS